jgi:hypothetical protein
MLASRRSVLRGGAAVAIGAALGALDLLPFVKPRAAAALTEWTDNDCHGFWSPTQTCVPSTAYFQADNCSGSWHKNFFGWINDCVAADYDPNEIYCAGKNAWRWYHMPSNYTKCSDGYKYSYNYCAGAVAVDNFSICRTNH